jgi:hypothetical protein
VKKTLVALLFLFLSAFMIGCGAKAGEPAPPAITVSVSPANVTVVVGATQQFRVTVTGSTNTAVNWSIAGTGCNGSACGAIDATGLYTAPTTVSSALTITVSATLQSDPTKSGTSRVTVPVISVTVSPASPTVVLGGTQQFTAAVTAADTAVAWSVTNGPGTITSAGLYSAPATLTTPATVTITAVAHVDSSKSGTATITIPAVTVAVTPATPTVMLGATLQLAATAGNATDKTVTWTMTGPGSVSSAGLYTAPATLTTPATATVKATSVADPTKSGVATITIPAVTVAVTPNTSNVILGASQQFAGTVDNATNTAVSWSISGPGTISNTGVYSAPGGNVITPATVTIIATSQADPTKSGSATVTIPAVAVTISPGTATLGGGGTQQFAATVYNATNKGVTWSVSGGGTIDVNGLFTAPTVVTTLSTATVTATSVADSSKFGRATVTLIPISVAVSPAVATVAINATQQFTALVSGTPNLAVTWSLSGAGCSGSSCGTLSATGFYTAPASVPNPATVTITATSVADPTKSGTATVTIASNLNTKLNGQYAFSFSGFDAMGKKVAMIGSFTADGNGNLTGMADLNSMAGTLYAWQAFKGSYTVDSTDRFVITTNLPSSPAFRGALDSTGDSGVWVEFDSTGTRGTGVFKRQTTSDFVLSQISGDYAFGFSGTDNSGVRQGTVGRFHADGAGNVTAGAADSVTVGDTLETIPSFTGLIVLNAGSGAAGGRGTMTVNIPGQGIVNFGFYMVDRQEMFLLVEDAVAMDIPLLDGVMVAQHGPFANSSLQGAAVFQLSGVTLQPSTTAVWAGRLMANSGSASMTGEFMRNWAGLVPPLQAFNATYSIASNGRGTITSSTFGLFVLYMVNQNKAFVLKHDFNEAATGMLEAQIVPAGGFTNAALQGIFQFSNPTATTGGVPLFVGSVVLDGAGNWTAIGDRSWVGGDLGDFSAAGVYNFTSSTTGRGTISQTSPSAANHVFYAVSANRILAVDVDPGILEMAVGIWQK